MILDERACRFVIAADPLYRDLEGFIGREAEPTEIACLATQAILEDIQLGRGKRSVPFHVGAPTGDCVSKELFVHISGPLVMLVAGISDIPY